MDVGEMQTQLRRWAAEEKSNVFGDLSNRLHDEEWRRTAQVHVRPNAGSRTAGCDGVTRKDFEEDLEGNRKRRRDALKEKRCEPRPVRRTYIREVKAGGRVQMRPLGIPAIRDRIAQEALRMIREPIGEADFSRHADGFRPDRSPKDAAVSIGGRLMGHSSQR